MSQPSPVCPYCGDHAVKTNGADIYKSRPDLANLTFWVCRPCGAYVGCHKEGAFTRDKGGRKVYSDGSLPLGRLASKYLRRAKSDAHLAMDPLWENTPDHRAERVRIYEWLSKKMGIPLNECHIGEFDIGQCRRVIALCEERRGINQFIPKDPTCRTD